MIGKVCISLVQYYDTKQKKTLMKKRPVLIISGPLNNDYTVLPISSISRRENVDYNYDIHICDEYREILNLDKDSFIRTHKQFTIHRASIYKPISDMKQLLPTFYSQVLNTMSKHQQYVMEQALS